MKWQGDSLKRLVEKYEEKHPSEFSSNKNSKAYKQTKATHREMMKKRLQRLKDFLWKL
jgi:tRNA A37 methylthiotransferase MiaB